MAAIVLAGGGSRRMGADKALMPFRGMTLLDNAIEIGLRACGTVIVVGPAKAAVAKPIGVIVVPDLFPGAGPLGGIITGLKAAPEGYHAVYGCDMPFVNPSLLMKLIDCAQGWDCAVPEVGGSLEPLCAVYHTRCASELRSQLEAGQRAVHRAIGCLRLCTVPETILREIDPDLKSFVNLNTPEEFDRLIGTRSS